MRRCSCRTCTRDHHADLASLYVNAMFGRKVPLEIWGPSSEKPELGLAASIEGLRQVCCQNLPMYIMCPMTSVAACAQ